MTWQQNKVKKIYDETATLITNLGLRNHMNWEEMYFLLKLLDEVIINRSYPQLLQLIEEWQRLPQETEIDSVIKNCLLSLDFKNTSSINEGMTIMQELLLALDQKGE